MSQSHGTPESHAESAHAPDPAHHTDAHDAGHAEHAPDTLGPVDWRMGLVGVVGVIAALFVVAAFVVATDFRFLTIG
jgi:hypothetical protein